MLWSWIKNFLFVMQSNVFGLKKMIQSPKIQFRLWKDGNKGLMVTIGHGQGGCVDQGGCVRMMLQIR